MRGGTLKPIRLGFQDVAGQQRSPAPVNSAAMADAHFVFRVLPSHPEVFPGYGTDLVRPPHSGNFAALVAPVANPAWIQLAGSHERRWA